jgi:KUP system potassium uptake protein
LQVIFKKLEANSSHSAKLQSLKTAGVLVALGIVFGDIGTSPLYVMKAILGASKVVDEMLVVGALSCIIWTLTLQTTIKYVIITLRADNHGEGGIFSLFALLRNRYKRLFVFAIIGGSALLADGVITPSITVTSAVEGLKLVNPAIPVIPIVLSIIAGLFFIQQFGTSFVGKSFGPIMAIWFIMLGTLGVSQLIHNPLILKAFNPYYAYELLTHTSGGFLLLAAVFLCTTGAEALYADLGHCGLNNIRVSWIFVKIMLILNYLGQGAWILNNLQSLQPGTNPFFTIMPPWFLYTGIAMATLAAIIASQALISGSFTLISEAISLNFWPNARKKYPSQHRGQMFIPSINWLLFVSCCFVILLFQSSDNMQAAYGLSISITMMMTSVLVFFYLKKIKVAYSFRLLFAGAYMIIEISFLIANLHKFPNGGWFTIVIASLLSAVMFIMIHGRKVRNRYMTFEPLAGYLPIISELSHDKTIPKFAGDLVYTSHANILTDLESKTIQSILMNQPKRADRYWFLHVDVVDDPYRLEYKVTELWPKKIIRIDFYLGFKVQPRINSFFKQILNHMSDENSIDLISSHPSLNKYNIRSDFRFVHIDRRVAKNLDLKFFDRLAINMYYRLKQMGLSDINAFGLDANNVTVEKIPLTIPNLVKVPIISKV